jgi:predicted transcriptional regulator
MRSISLKLPDELHARLTQASSQRGTAKSDLIRDALESYLAGERNGVQISCADLADDLIGSISGPTDLASNPKHLEGYGQ